MDTTESAGLVNLEIVDGQVYETTIQVHQDGVPINMKLESMQHDYSAPMPTQQYIIEQGSQDNENAGEDEGVEDDVDLSGAGPGDQLAMESVPPDTITPSMSHHDYISSLPVHIIKAEPPVSEPVETFMELPPQEELVVVEEAAEEEITSHTLTEDEMVRSRPLTAMYLQRKEISISDTVYLPGVVQQRIPLSPSKSPSTSTFRLKPSRNMDYSLINGSDDTQVMRLAYSDPISVYHPSTGEIELKAMPSEHGDRRRKGQHKSVGAILAASEAIKHQDIASEVEIETCEMLVSQTKQGGRKRKTTKKGGIDDDIETIKKAAKNVAFTLKGMSKSDKDGRRKKKPRIRLTLTKSKSRRNSNQAAYFSEEEYESSSPVKSRKKRKVEHQDGEDMPNIIYQCEYCEKQFKTREKVRCHTKIHTEDRQYACDECGASYRRREHLVRHYRRHSNDRPYECLECGKSYMRAEHLKRHSFFHSGEKPFQCAECPKAFARHDRLIKHSLVHDK